MFKLPFRVLSQTNLFLLLCYTTGDKDWGNVGSLGELQTALVKRAVSAIRQQTQPLSCSKQPSPRGTSLVNRGTDGVQELSGF